MAVRVKLNKLCFSKKSEGFESTSTETKTDRFHLKSPIYQLYNLKQVAYVL